MLLLYRAIAGDSALHGLAFRVAGEAFGLMGELPRLPVMGSLLSPDPPTTGFPPRHMLVV